MDEKNLLRVALVCSIVGILIILFISERVGLEFNIANINDGMIGEEVQIKGEIISLRETPGLLLLDVEDGSGRIKVVVFKSGEISLEEGDLISVEGEVKEYEGGLEIEAGSVKVF